MAKENRENNHITPSSLSARKVAPVLIFSKSVDIPALKVTHHCRPLGFNPYSRYENRVTGVGTTRLLKTGYWYSKSDVFQRIKQDFLFVGVKQS